MVASHNSEAGPSTNLDASLSELEPINEDDQIWAPLGSPENLVGHFDYFCQKRPPDRSRTYPFIPPGPFEEHLKLLGRISNGNQRDPKRRFAPPVSKRIVRTESNVPGPNRMRHSSTIDTNNSASFEDTAVWDQKAILSLDGGGIRGYSALLILRELMRAIGRIERNYAGGPSNADGPAVSSYHPLAPLSPAPCITTSKESQFGNRCEPAGAESSPWLPCHYFDYVAGTSTGGLIGIMLGRLRMNVDDCISEYEILGAKVFGQSRKFHLRSPLFWPRDKYNFKTLENVVRDVVSRRVPKVPEFPGGRNFAFDENRCRTVVVAFQQQRKAGAEKPYLFRTYKNLHKSQDLEERELDRNPDMAHDIPIWQVARATSAAPTYFKPPLIDGLEYVDGGFGANNPCVEIFEEVRRMNNNSKRCTSIILSIGTGKNNEARRFKGTGVQRYLNYLNFARRWASDSEETHLAMLKKKRDSEAQFDYFRLNVEKGLDLMKLDDWRARGPVRTNIGERIGSLRSSSPKVWRKGRSAARAGVTNGQQADVLKENDDNVQDRNGTIPTNGSVGYAAQQAFREPGEQISDQTYVLDATNNTSVTHSEHSVGGAHTHTFDQQDGHPPTTGIPLQTSDPNGDDTMIPQWFRHKNQTLKSIRNYTEDYLAHPNTINMIEKCAKLLVEGRRGRAKSDPQRWEKVCFGTWYQCRISGCPRGEKEYERRWQLRKHLLDKHKNDFTRGVEGKSKLEDALDSCKIVVH